MRPTRPGLRLVASCLVLSAAPSAQNVALVTDWGAGRIHVFDTVAEAVVASIDIGLAPGDQDECPGRVALSADGTLGLAPDIMGNLFFLDVTGGVLAAGTNPVATFPLGTDVAFGIDERYALVVGASSIIASIDVAARSQVAFVDFGTNALGVEVGGDGSAFVTAATSLSIRRYLMNGDGTITYTGEQLNTGGLPVDSYAAPGGKSVVVVNRDFKRLRSFEVPLAYVDLLTTSDVGYAGAFSSDGTRFYEREVSELVVWGVDPVSGHVDATPLASDVLPFVGPCETLCQIGVNPDNGRVYVPIDAGIEVHDPDSGAWLYTITDPALVRPIGIAFPTRKHATVGFGCEVNPPGSLTKLSGAAVPGETLVLGVDNPLGTQPAGSVPFLAISSVPDPAFPCGTALPGFGMTGPGASGELLVLPVGPFLTVAGAPWGGPGTPTPFPLPLPNNPAFLGDAYYAQGLIVDPAGATGVSFGLTTGALIRIGL